MKQVAYFLETEPNFLLILPISAVNYPTSFLHLISRDLNKLYSGHRKNTASFIYCKSQPCNEVKFSLCSSVTFIGRNEIVFCESSFYVKSNTHFADTSSASIFFTTSLKSDERLCRNHSHNSLEKTLTVLKNLHNYYLGRNRKCISSTVNAVIDYMRHETYTIEGFFNAC